MGLWVIINMIYLVTLDNNTCGLMEATNITQAKSEALKEHGTRNLRSVTVATDEDIHWVETMGGWTPTEINKKKKKGKKC